MLRAAADGELSPAQRAELEATLTESETGAIATEAALRQAVGRVMAGPVAPAGLRDRVLAAAGAADATAEAYPDLEDDAPPAPIPMAPWLRPLSVAAAVILMVAGGMLILRAAGGGASPAPRQQLASGDAGGEIQLVELRQFMTQEHDRCFRDEDHAARKFSEARLAEIPERFRDLLGSEISIEEMLKAGLTLEGAGKCHVPGPGKSIHLRLRAVLPDGPLNLSLFVQNDSPNRLALQEGAPYELTPADGSAAKLKIIAWRRAGLAYYLVAEPEACERVRAAMGRGGPCERL